MRPATAGRKPLPRNDARRPASVESDRRIGYVEAVRAPPIRRPPCVWNAESVVRIAQLIIALFVVPAGLSGCDDDDPPPVERDAAVPENCLTRGCPAGEACQSSGRCATAAEVADGVRACTALSACLGACPDQRCVEQCFLEAPDEGFRRYVEIVDCLDVAGCFTDEGLDEACMFAACGPEYVACFGALPPRPEGAAHCGAFVRCINDCPVDPPEDEQACLDGCVSDASREAFDRYVAAVNCIQLECVDQPPSCQQERCGDSLAACFDHGLGTGTLPCGDVLQCVFSCPDSECYTRCEQDASAEALLLWRDFVDCAAPAGCAGFDACLAACPDETRACRLHGP